jgi:branched-chain amino acid transport system ATP-binding protein
MSLLVAQAVSVRFGGIAALTDVDLVVEPGESVGLIGPNGAGKTTMFNCILGLLRPNEGRIFFDGVDVTSAPVYRRARAGMGRTFQRLELFPGMTVREHLLVADRAHRRRGGLWRDLFTGGEGEPGEETRVGAVLDLVGLTDAAELPVEALSLGHGRIVELGRALMTEPKLLLLDEPSSGLDRAESFAFAEVLAGVQRDRGTAILFVEHDLELVHRVVSRAYVLDFGTLIATGTPAEVMAAENVRRAYLGAVV